MQDFNFELMRTFNLSILIFFVFSIALYAQPQVENPRVHWLKGNYGVMVHWLFPTYKNKDVDKLADEPAERHAGDDQHRAAAGQTLAVERDHVADRSRDAQKDRAHAACHRQRLLKAWLQELAEKQSCDAADQDGAGVYQSSYHRVPLFCISSLDTAFEAVRARLR